MKRLVFVLVLSFVMLLTVSTTRASLGQFSGLWNNVDANTRGITKLEIGINGANVSVHAWGKCSPTDCDWGQAEGFGYAATVSDNLPNAAQAISAIYNTNFSQTILVIRPVGSRLQAEVLTRFTDNSGRTSYRNVYTFAHGIMPVSVPVQVSPPNGSVFDIFPRTTKLTWNGVGGAAYYGVEIDCFHCCQNNAWCTDIGRTWKVVPKVTSTSYTFDFVGAQPGRWRVWAVDANNTAGPKSGWWEFRYTR